MLNVTLHRANFAGSSLIEADLKSANLQEADFLEADLSHASMLGVFATRVNLFMANMQAIDWREGVLEEADL